MASILYFNEHQMPEEYKIPHINIQNSPSHYANSIIIKCKIVATVQKDKLI